MTQSARGKASQTAEMRYFDWQYITTRLRWIYEGAPVFPHGQFKERQSGAWLLTQGELIIQGERESHKVEPGTWVFVPRSRNAREFSPDASILSVKFSFSWPSLQELFEFAEPLLLPASEHPELEKRARTLLHCVRSGAGIPTMRLSNQPMALDYYLQVKCVFMNWVESYAHSLLSLGYEPNPSSLLDQRLAVALHSLEQHPLQEPLDLGAITKEAGLSQSQLARLFRKQFGTSMRQYYEERRHATAVFDLSKTTLQIKEIAYGLGFKDISAFSHWFRKQEGCSPRDFRERQMSSQRTGHADFALRLHP